MFVWDHHNGFFFNFYYSIAINSSSLASSSWILSIFFELYSSSFLSCSSLSYFNLLNSASSSLCQGYRTIVWNISALDPTIKLVIGRKRVRNTILLIYFNLHFYKLTKIVCNTTIIADFLIYFFRIFLYWL